MICYRFWNQDHKNRLKYGVFFMLSKKLGDKMSRLSKLKALQFSFIQLLKEDQEQFMRSQITRNGQNMR